jgi:hypothetical protein
VIPAARDPGPLVTFVRNRTVANVDSIGFVVLKWIPVLGRIVVELQQGSEQSPCDHWAHRLQYLIDENRVVRYSLTDGTAFVR